MGFRVFANFFRNNRNNRNNINNSSVENTLNNTPRIKKIIPKNSEAIIDLRPLLGIMGNCFNMRRPDSSNSNDPFDTSSFSSGIFSISSGYHIDLPSISNSHNKEALIPEIEKLVNLLYKRNFEIKNGVDNFACRNQEIHETRKFIKVYYDAELIRKEIENELTSLSESRENGTVESDIIDPIICLLDTMFLKYKTTPIESRRTEI